MTNTKTSNGRSLFTRYGRVSRNRLPRNVRIKKIYKQRVAPKNKLRQ